MARFAIDRSELWLRLIWAEQLEGLRSDFSTPLATVSTTLYPRDSAHVRRAGLRVTRPSPPMQRES